MKKILALVCALTLCGGILAGCDEKKDDDKKEDKTSVTSAAEKSSSENESDADSSSEESSSDEESDANSSSQEENSSDEESDTDSSDESSESDSSSEDENSSETDSDNDSSSQAAEPAKISDNLYDFEVSVNGEKLKVPTTFTELESLGWKIDYEETLEKEIQPNGYLIGPQVSNGDKEIRVYPYNFGKSNAKAKDCQIMQLKFNGMYGDDAPDVVIAKNITLGKSTYDDVIKAYGKPDKENTVNDTKELVYKKAQYLYYQLEFDKDNILKTIDISNVKM